MTDYYFNSYVTSYWNPNTAYGVGSMCCATPYKVFNVDGNAPLRVYICCSGGTSGASEPTWQTNLTNITCNNGMAWKTYNPTTWLNPCGFVVGALYQNKIATGDRCFLSTSHWEVASINQSQPFGNGNVYGTITNPIQIISTADTVNEPPLTQDVGARIEWRGNHSYFSDHFYFYGVRYTLGSTEASARNMYMGWWNGHQTFENCRLTLGQNGASYFVFGQEADGNQGGRVLLKNTELEFTNVAQCILMGKSQFEWNGGGPIGVSPTTLISNLNNKYHEWYLRYSGLDLTPARGNIFNASYAYMGNVAFNNCKVDGSANLVLNAPPQGDVYIMFDGVDTGQTTIRMKRVGYAGTVDEDVSTYMIGGASDGVTPNSWKLVTNANASLWAARLHTPWLPQYNEAVNVPKTVTIEFCHDAITALKDTEVWIEVQYMGTVGSTMTTWVTDQNTNILCGAYGGASGTAQETSTVQWVTLGMSTPSYQKVSVTVTPRVRGPIMARLVLGKASKTIYVNPQVSVT